MTKCSSNELKTLKNVQESLIYVCVETCCGCSRCEAIFFEIYCRDLRYPQSGATENPDIAEAEIRVADIRQSLNGPQFA